MDLGKRLQAPAYGLLPIAADPTVNWLQHPVSVPVTAHNGKSQL
jgi:hypothetical protein